MKRNILRISVAAILLVALSSCNKKEANPAETTTTENPADTAQINNDKEVLSNDSATVETAVGVKDEEANAKSDEKKADEKLESDEKKAK